MEGGSDPPVLGGALLNAACNHFQLGSAAALAALVLALLTAFQKQTAAWWKLACGL